MQHDRVETETVQEGEGKCQIVELVGENSTANPEMTDVSQQWKCELRVRSGLNALSKRWDSLQDGEFGLGQDTAVLSVTGDTSSVREDPQVSFDFVPGAQRVEQPDNGVPVHPTGDLGGTLVQSGELAGTQLAAELSDIEGEEW